MNKTFLNLLGVLLLGLVCSGPQREQVIAGEKKEKNPQEGKKGTVIGTLTAKGDRFIEVKADGEERGRKYIPQWRGGAPAKGGGPDKEMLKTFQSLKVGSRIEVEWLFEEHLRTMKVTVLKAAEK